jgi:hypothetical protein
MTAAQLAEVRALLGCSQTGEARQSTTAKLTEFEQLEWQLVHRLRKGKGQRNFMYFPRFPHVFKTLPNQCEKV